MKTGVYLIAEERRKVIGAGRGVHHDIDHNSGGELLLAAVALLHDDEWEQPQHDQLPPEAYRVDNMPADWNAEECEKMVRKSKLDRLVIAGQLIAAEIDRMHEEERRKAATVEMAHNPENPSERSHRDAMSVMFREAVDPAIMYLCENWTPHSTIIVTSTSGELMTGELHTGEIMDHVKD